MKKIIVSVTNDLSTDQRVDKMCRKMISQGYEVLLVGRKLPNSLPLNDRSYKTKRMWLLFKSGPLFYIEYSFRLLLLLLVKSSDVLVANDLDTLLPNYLVSKIKRKKLVYDSHEYFTEVPELANSPFKKSIWKRIEKLIFPKLENIITVNQSIANLYEEEYNKKIYVVRNVPETKVFEKIKKNLKSRKDLGLPENKQIIIIQGSGINMHRGAEEAVEAMQYIEGKLLLIIGGGDVIDILKETTQKLHLKDKVRFINKLPYEEMLHYTYNANLGLSLDKDTNLNYRYSLPNKLFDYIHADLPVIVTNLPELVNIVDTYNVGMVINDLTPLLLAEKIELCLSNLTLFSEAKENIRKAKSELNWGFESRILEKIYTTV